MSARTVLWGVFAFLIVALAGQALTSILQARENDALEASEDRRNLSFRLADELRQSSDDLSRFARTYAVTGDERFRSYYRQILLIRDGKVPRPVGYEGVYWDFVAATHRSDAEPGRQVALLDLMKELGFTPDELEKLAEAKRRSDALVDLESRAMDAMEGRVPADDGRIVQGAPDPALARELLHGAAYHEAKAAIMQPIHEFFGLVDARTTAAVDVHRRWSARLGAISVVVALLAAVVAVVALVLLSRRMLRPVRDASDRLQGLAVQLDAASGEQQVGASEQSASVEETRQTFSGLRDATGRLARVGGEVLEHAELAHTSAQAIADRIRELSASTTSIAEILRMVKDIAGKSEILALNAALEGTKAGEAGRGFSLVATQMQRLAEKVMGAAKRIEELTGHIATSSQNAVLAAEEAEKVATLTTASAREIAEAVSLQQAGAEQVGVAMDEIARVADRSVGAARDLVQSAQALKTVAGRLQQTLHGRA